MHLFLSVASLRAYKCTSFFLFHTVSFFSHTWILKRRLATGEEELYWWVSFCCIPSCYPKPSFTRSYFIRPPPSLREVSLSQSLIYLFIFVVFETIKIACLLYRPLVFVPLLDTTRRRTRNSLAVICLLFFLLCCLSLHFTEIFWEFSYFFFCSRCRVQNFENAIEKWLK